MSESSLRSDAGVPAVPDAGAFYAAVGIPQGVIVDSASGEIAGAVRIGGDLVSLSRVEYGLWHLLLTPMTRASAIAAASRNGLDNPDAANLRLENRNLVVTIRPGRVMDGDLARLRPIPLGVGLGNLKGDPTRFKIQNSKLSLPSPVSLDGVAIMLWWELDGTASLREAVARVASRLPELSLDLVETAATRLVHGLMANRLLHLDAPRTTNEANDL